MKKYLTIIWFAILCSWPAISQIVNTANSINQKISDSDNNIEYLFNQAKTFIVDSPEISYDYAIQAKELAEKNKNEEAIAYACYIIGNTKLNKNEYYNARKYLLNALNYYKKHEDNNTLAEIHFLLGKINYFLGNYDDAIQNYYQALHLYSEIKDLQNIANTYQNIGLVHHNLNNLDEALNYYDKSIAINKRLNNLENVAGLTQNIGIIHYRHENYNDALEYYKESLNLFEKLDDIDGIATINNNIGLIYKNKNNFNRALAYFRKAEQYYVKLDNAVGRLLALHNIGVTLVKTGKYNEAEKYLLISLKIADKYKYADGALANYKELSELYTKKEDYKKAISFYKLFNNLNDSINSIGLKEKIAELEALYNIEQRELEINVKNTELKKSKLIRTGLILGLAFLFCITIIIYYAYRQKRKAEKELEKHKKNLEILVEKRTEELKNEITERKIIEESDKLKSAFLANMSHELRTPLNAILGFSNFLKEPDINHDNSIEYINYIIEAGNNLLHLLDDIIDSAKIDSKLLKINFSQTNVTTMVNDLYRVLNENRANKDIEFRVKNNTNKNIYIYTDPFRLKQILQYLVDNALKYTNIGHVEFGFEVLKNQLRFFVKDSGIGIPKEKQEFVFQRFAQIDYSLNRKFGGAGLGLAISKNLVELMGGEIWLESDENKGSVFHFTLPFEKMYEKDSADTPETIRVKKKDIQYDWHDKTILVAEDEDLNYKVLEKILKKTNAKIMRAEDGKKAIELCKKHWVNLILMDIKMPLMDGFEATTEIRKEYNKLPIIAQTSFALAEEKQKCLAAGCDDYLSKPFDLDELLEKIAKYIN